MALYANLYGPEIVEYPNQAHARNVPILVKNPNGSTATLYTGPERAMVADNPVVTDSLGNLAFWADPGSYLLDAPGVSSDIPVIVMTSPAEPGGGGGGDGSFRHVQNTPAAEWTWNHEPGISSRWNSREGNHRGFPHVWDRREYARLYNHIAWQPDLWLR